MRETLPTVYTARYLTGRLPDEGLVPVRVSMRESVVPLSYEVEELARALVPEEGMTGEWPALSPLYFGQLDGAGVGAVADELAGISDRCGGRPLVLLDHEDTLRGDRSLRVIFQQWWEEQTGESVLELADDGRDLHYHDLPKRTRPKKPKIWTADRRWRDDAALGLSWPLSEEKLMRWVALRHWQQARSPHNPHAYTVRSWGSDEPFWLVVMHIREHGEQEEWGGDTYYVIEGMKYWTMGADLMSTVILNRKPFGQDPQDGEKGTGEETGWGQSGAEPPAEAPLFNRDGCPLTLAQRINAEHRACTLAAGSAVRHAVRCGGLLREAKAEAGHGNWLTWLQENFEGSPRTAQLYMMLHRERSEARGDAGSGTTLRPLNAQVITHSGAEATRRGTA